MRRGRHAAVAAVVAVAAAVAACGGEDGTAGEPTSPTPAQTSSRSDVPDAAEPEPVVEPAGQTSPSPYATTVLTATDRDGWIYTLTPTFGSVAAVWDKEVEDSPPGKGRFTGMVSLGDGFSFELMGVTPGRNTPPRDVGPVSLFYPVPDSARFAELEATGVVSGGTQCSFDRYTIDAAANDGPYWSSGLLCSLPYRDAAASVTREPGYSVEHHDEALIDELIASLQGLEPIIIVQPFRLASCRAYYLPDGQVELDTDTDTDDCTLTTS